MSKPVLLATALGYAWVAVDQLRKGNSPMFFVFAFYAGSNIAMIFAVK